jgi:cholesterol transport system auxiliary component
MKSRIFNILALTLIIIGVNACSIRPKASALHDLGYVYTINGASETTTQIDQKQSPVTVEAPKWLEDSGIHYRLMFSSPTQIRTYAMDRWVASPPELFEQLLNNSGKQWPKSLIINLHAFEQQFDAPEKAKALMQFTATTLPDEKSNHSIKREFTLQRPCPTADAKGAVTAFTELTRQASDKIQAWLITVH